MKYLSKLGIIWPLLAQGIAVKIVTWNCNGALRKKIEHLETLNADLYIIQECEDPARSTQAYRDWAGDYLWIGESKNKGIGIFPKNGNRVQALPWSGSFSLSGLVSTSASLSWRTEDLKLFLPFTLNDKYTILAVWTKGNSDKQAFGYMGQLWKYLQIHREQLTTPNTMLIGDLNSNSQWDKEDRWWSHTDVVNELSAIGLASLYHMNTGEEQGSESQPTFYHQRKKEKAYHIDYAFASSNLASASHVTVGSFEDWIEVSDHVPLSVKI